MESTRATPQLVSLPGLMAGATWGLRFSSQLDAWRMAFESSISQLPWRGLTWIDDEQSTPPWWGSWDRGIVVSRVLGRGLRTVTTTPRTQYEIFFAHGSFRTLHPGLHWLSYLADKRCLRCQGLGQSRMR